MDLRPVLVKDNFLWDIERGDSTP